MEEKRFIMEVVMKEIIFSFVVYLNSPYNLDISLFVGLIFQLCKMVVSE